MYSGLRIYNYSDKSHYVSSILVGVLLEELDASQQHACMYVRVYAWMEGRMDVYMHACLCARVCVCVRAAAFTSTLSLHIQGNFERAKI